MRLNAFKYFSLLKMGANVTFAFFSLYIRPLRYDLSDFDILASQSSLMSRRQ